MHAKLLVVDDEPMVLNLCDAILTRRGFSLHLAASGEEGLELFRRLHAEIDLVLSDMAMHGMDGPEMVRQMFEIKPHSNVILMTGYSQKTLVPEDVRRICAIIEKPFTSKKLIAEIEHCLKKDSNPAPYAPISSPTNDLST